jgi:hypothetical protein
VRSIAVLCIPRGFATHACLLGTVRLYDVLPLLGLIALNSGNVYYLHKNWNGARLLSKVKGAILESVAWNPLATDTATKKILLGTNRGLIYETHIEEKDKYFKKVSDTSQGLAFQRDDGNCTAFVLAPADVFSFPFPLPCAGARSEQRRRCDTGPSNRARWCQHSFERRIWFQQ